jgi:hypothetical protein
VIFLDLVFWDVRKLRWTLLATSGILVKGKSPILSSRDIHCSHLDRELGIFTETKAEEA